MVYKVYQTKHILNIHKHVDGGWFWNKYSAFPYVGCEWGCEYCYWRDEKYNPHKPSRDPGVLKFKDPFSEYIKIKENAPELLRQALKNKPRDLIYLDNYQPIENKYRYVRQMLKVYLDLNFPVFINEKSPQLLQDLDLLKRLSKKSYLNVGWSIITAEDNQTKIAFEPKAPSIKARFRAMEKLARNNILTGSIFMPVLPFISDTEENIETLIRQTKESGGQYLLGGGLTLWGHCKTHFYQALEKYKPSLIQEYENLYQNQKALARHAAQVHRLVLKHCQKYQLTPFIPRPISFYPKDLQINKKIAEKFYLRARELQLSGKKDYREWAYRKAAWSLDNLEKDIKIIYQDQGRKGIIKIKNIGPILAKEIEKLLSNKA